MLVADRQDSSRESRGPRACRAKVTRFAPRSKARLHQFLQQLTAAEEAGGTLPAGTLGHLLYESQPLWRLLLETAGDNPELGPEVRSLLTRVLSDGAARMRGLVKQLAGELMELPYFSSNGQLTKDIDLLVDERLGP